MSLQKKRENGGEPQGRGRRIGSLMGLNEGGRGDGGGLIYARLIRRPPRREQTCRRGRVHITSIRSHGADTQNGSHYGHFEQQPPSQG